MTRHFPSRRWALSYEFPAGLTVDYGGALTGPMRLPEFQGEFARPTRNDPYATHDVQLSWAWSPGRRLTVGVRNVGDFTQPSPLVDPGRPFGDAFDTSTCTDPSWGGASASASTGPGGADDHPGASGRAEGGGRVVRLRPLGRAGAGGPAGRGRSARSRLDPPVAGRRDLHAGLRKTRPRCGPFCAATNWGSSRCWS